VRPQLIVYLSLVVVPLSGCKVFLPAHPKSHFDDEVEVTLEVSENTNLAKAPEIVPMSGAAAAAATAAGVLIDLADKALEAEAKEYTASYTAKASGEFYHDYKVVGGAPSSLRVRPHMLMLRRTAEGSTASEFDFELRPSSAGDAFRLYLNGMQIHKSMAKVFDTRWWNRAMLYGLLLPLFTDTGDGEIDVVIQVKFEATWTDKNSLSHRATLADLEWKIGDYSLDENKRIENKPADHDRPVFSSDWIPAPPLSVSTNGVPIGRGNYTVTITVTETDDFGEYVQKASEELRKNKDKITERVSRYVTEFEEKSK